MKHAAKDDKIGFVVNISGRFTMKNGPSKHTAEEMAHLKEHGHFFWPIRAKGEVKKVKVTQADIDEFSAYDNSDLASLRYSLPVLTCFGQEDEVVPVADCVNYANVIENHTLRIIPGANHSYKGKCGSSCLMNDETQLSFHSFPLPSLLPFFADAELIKIVVDWIQITDSGKHAKLLKNVRVSRVISLRGVTNFRDVGGYPTSNGLTVRPRTVFRSGEYTTLPSLGFLFLFASTFFSSSSFLLLTQTSEPGKH